MSSYTNTRTQDDTDPSQQIAPSEDSGPDFGALKDSFQSALSNNRYFIDQCERNRETRFALWNGQSADGKKHGRGLDGKTDPTPWDGASDLQVFLADEAINAKVAMLCMGFRKANLVATPIEGNDLERSKVVGNFMRWLIQTQIKEVDREIELAAQYLQEKGIAATGQFWEVTQEKKLQTVRLSDMQKKAPQVDLSILIQSETMGENLRAVFENTYGCTAKKSLKMLKELRKTGETTVAVVGKQKSRPVIRAFDLDHNLIVDPSATDIETAPAIWRVEYFSPEQLRSFVNTDGWDKAWVEKAIECCLSKSLYIENQELNRRNNTTLLQNIELVKDKVGVVYGYQRLSDEEDVPGIYLTVFTPHLPPDSDQEGYAKTGLLGYAHGEYPFVIHRREYLSRRMHDSRGLPEPAKPYQDQIKAHKDSLVDAASIAIIPPIMYPLGRPPLKWGAGARIPERRPGEYHFADRPAPDINTQNSEQQLRADFNQYNGFVSSETDPQFSALKNQQEMNKFLGVCAKMYKQIWKLYQQFGSEETYFRVIGLKNADPTLMEKGDPEEEYDINLTWDVQSMDYQRQGEKMEMMGKAINTYDKYGAVDYTEWLQVILDAIDPNIAERIIQPQSVGVQKAIQDEHTALSQIFSGIPKDITPGSPPDIGLQQMEQWMQQPDVAQRYQTDEAFKNRVDTRVKQYQFQKQQAQNAQIGKMGAVNEIPNSMQQQPA